MSGWLDAVSSALSGELFSFFLRLIGPMPRTFFEKLSIHGRPIALTTTLIQSVDGLNMAIMKRNQLVEFYKASSSPPNQLLALYFGFPFTEDRLIRNILTQWRPSSHRPTTAFSSARSCSKARDDDLMPSDGNYADWVNMFVKSGG